MPETVSTSELRRRLSEILSRAHYLGEETAVTRHGRHIASIVSHADAELLRQARSLGVVTLDDARRLLGEPA